MRIVPFRLTLGFQNTKKVNGSIVGGYRVQFTSIRGFSLQLYSLSNFGFGRGLIANSFTKSDSNLLVPRAMAILDTLQYSILGPICILINLILWFVYLFVGIVTFPFWCCFPEKIKQIQLFSWVLVVTVPITLLLNIVAFIINPMQIFVPELFLLLKYDQWDTGLQKNELI